MIAGWIAILIAVGYVCALFALARWGDRAGRLVFAGKFRAPLYTLGLCIYCTSWTFFGAVGLASSSGFDFIPVYFGPILVFAFGHRWLARMARLSKAHSITTLADFVSARYGKSDAVASVVALVAVVAVIPYIALQIKAISQSFSIVFGQLEGTPLESISSPSSMIALGAAAILALFTAAFGLRRVEATQHRTGVMLVVGVESIVKLASLLAVGAFVVWGMFSGPLDLFSRAWADPHVRLIFSRWPDPLTWIAGTLMSASAVLLLPSQFHVAIVENRNERDVGRAAAYFPLYLIAISLFVAPIAMAGLILCPGDGVSRDMVVLALPFIGGSPAFALVAMIGGFSAAAAMVVIACLALSIMVSNDLVIPLLLRSRALRPRIGETDVAGLILWIRRAAVIGLIALAYGFVILADQEALAQIGVVSLAAIVQIAPAFFGGVMWRRANARGALAGMTAGMAVWSALLLYPVVAGHGASPDELAGSVAMLAHGALFSILANVAAFVLVSLSRQPTQIEHVQAAIFLGEREQPIRLSAKTWQNALTLGDLEDLAARYIGAPRASAAFAAFFRHRGAFAVRAQLADGDTMRFVERTLASVIGAASTRLVLSLALRRHDLSRAAALEIVDEASAAIQHNQKLLQHAIDFAQQGISVFDAELRLVFWNREFAEIFDYPTHLLQIGASLADMVRHDVARGLFGEGAGEAFVAQRFDMLVHSVEPLRLPMGAARGDSVGVIELRAARMPDGGLVVTYTDVTQQVEAEQALAQINGTLEQRVRERTDELVALNNELGRAKAAADEANVSKTRFLAAASHDILQPLNAARLFATALAERTGAIEGAQSGALSEAVALARNVDASLQAVEDILTALLDMSRLDAGAMKPELTVFRIDDILSQLQIEFAPLAAEKNLKLVFAPSSMAVRSDRRLLRRLLQNLVSNAIKYTASGAVLVGCRRKRGRMRIEVWDTGPGIPESKRKTIFREFERLENGVGGAHGLGLGLSIVERLGRVLGHKIALRSWPGRGSVFSVEAPAAPALPLVAPFAAGASPARHQPLAGLVVVAIDDEPRILEGMAALLEGWGCRLIAATGREEAESRIAAARLAPQVLIADYHLGAELGIDVLRLLRAKYGVELPAILLTADRTQGVRIEAENRGIALLNKPIKPAALRALLAQWHVTRIAAE